MTINFLNIIQVLIGLALIGFILIQRGPGATAGSAFGGGASGTVFGAKGSGSFLTKVTALLATAFFIVTMMIAIDSRSLSAGSDDATATEQDLGVMGSLDSSEQDEIIVPGDDVDGSAAVDQALADVIDSAESDMSAETDNAENQAVDEVEAAADAVTVDDESDQ